MAMFQLLEKFSSKYSFAADVKKSNLRQKLRKAEDIYSATNF